MKRLFLSVLSLFMIGFLFQSCDNAVTEETEEFFQYYLSKSTDPVTDMGKIRAFQNYKSVKTDTGIYITAYNIGDAYDSVEFAFKTVKGHDFLVGEYPLMFDSKVINVKFYAGDKLFSLGAGEMQVNYLNRRIDFDFEGTLTNGDRINGGMADNLVINTYGNKGLNGSVNKPNPEPGPDPGPDPEPTGDPNTIEGNFGGNSRKWNATMVSASFIVQAQAKNLTINALDPANNGVLGVAITNIDGNNINSIIGKTLKAADGAIISYIKPNEQFPYTNTIGGNASFKLTNYNANTNEISFEFHGQINNSVNANENMVITAGKGIKVKIE
ncbi:MAG: hypothetical protein N4A45_05065 [Flavobacteriales bacterium]|jgi:hypothetical protein|nr:hypothetical protein [Flavobacteriales bacterium]